MNINKFIKAGKKFRFKKSSNKRRCLLFYLGWTPKKRWKKTDGYYWDWYEFNDNGRGLRILWLILAFEIKVD